MAIQKWAKELDAMLTCEQVEYVPKTAQRGLALGQPAAQSLNIITACLSCSTASQVNNHCRKCSDATSWGDFIDIWNQVLVNHLRHAAQRSAYMQRLHWLVYSF